MSIINSVNICLFFHFENIDFINLIFHNLGDFLIGEVLVAIAHKFLTPWGTYIFIMHVHIYHVYSINVTCTLK